MNTIGTFLNKRLFVSIATALVTTAMLAPIAAHADCTFEGKSYSEGAVEKMGDGNLKICRDGRWV